jgi:hypothetical protein
MKERRENSSRAMTSHSALSVTPNSVMIGAALGAGAAVALLGALNLSAHQVKVSSSISFLLNSSLSLTLSPVE